jgi:LacI family transcriptional regulator
MKATKSRTTPVTTRDIARIVGVSQPVVSKVLNGGNGNVGASAKTCARVLKAARDLGYRSNTAARAMRTGRFGCAALLLGTHQSKSAMPMSLFHGLVDALAKHGMHLVAAKLPDAKLVATGVVPQLLTELFADGLLINYNAKIPAALIKLIQSYRLPAVWINSVHPVDCVYPDDQAAGRGLTEMLLGAGHRRVVFLNSDGTWHYSAAARRQGYVEAMTAAGVAPDVVEIHNRSTDEERHALVKALLDRAPRPLAVVCYTPRVCELLCGKAAARGWAMPSDLAVATFSADPFVWRDQSIPTMLLPEREIGAAAVAMLLKKIAKPDEAQPPQAVPCRLEGWT